MFGSTALRADQLRRAEGPDRELIISWPWWVNPVWALILLTGSMALVAISLDDSVYALWGARNFLTQEMSTTLLIAIAATVLGIFVGSGMQARGGTTTLRFNVQHVKYLRAGYRFMFMLVLIGYVIWAGSAVSQGVGLADLLSVVDRELGAIGQLKSSARPIGGLTTLTQLAPIVVVMGMLLTRIDTVGRGWTLLVLLAGVRTVFYAERLALIEILIPAMLVAALTVHRDSKWRGLSRMAPIICAPLVWVVFSISEYSRSWIYYQMTTTMPFEQWVSARLTGYYVTGFNNSALLALSHEDSHAEPYFSIPALWNAPGAPAHSGIFGFLPEDWWVYVLTTSANPEFNNSGSFLTTYAEFGFIGMVAFWLVAGLLIGGLFSGLTKGSVPSLISYAVIFVGILELPRFIYWTQGRSTPILVALVVIMLSYPRLTQARSPEIANWNKTNTKQRLPD